MKKICIVIDDLTKSGGTERVASFLADGLFSQYKVSIISLNRSCSGPFYSLPNDISITYLKHSKFRFFELFNSINRSNFDIVISISMGRLSFFLALIKILSISRYKLVMSEHVGFESGNMLIKYLKIFSYKIADQLVLLTSHDAKILSRKLPNKLVVIPNASTFYPLSPTYLPEKEKYFLAVGRLTYQKNFFRLIDIWSKLSSYKGWTLKIVGDGEDRDSLKAKIESLGLENSIEILPASRNIGKLYEKASALLMTSRYEGLPLVLIECKSFGVPAIAFDCETGPKEIINHGQDGYLVEYSDDQCFQHYIEYLIDNPKSLKSMQLCSIFNSASFSKDRILAKWIKLIDDI